MASPLPRNNALLQPVWFLACLLPATVFAASEWKVTSGVELSERYTDNVSLAASDPQSAFITEISPHIGVSRQGKRGSVNLAYSLTDSLYDSGQNNFTQDLDAAVQIEPVAGIFKVDGNARISQQYASQFGPISGGTYHNVSNQVETRSVSLTPSLHDEFFDRSLITDARLRLDYASGGSGSLGNSTSNDLWLSVRNGQRPERLTYSGSYERNSADSEGVATTIFESQSYNIGYAVYDRTRVFLSAGSSSTQGVSALQGKDYEYAVLGMTWWAPTHLYSLTGTAGRSYGVRTYGLTGNWAPSSKFNLAATVGTRNDAPSYNLNGYWAPSALTSLSVLAENNYEAGTFGVGTTSHPTTDHLSAYGDYTSYEFHLTHRLRRSVLGLSYVESVVNASQQLYQTGTFPFYLCGSVFQPAVPGEPIPSGCAPVNVSVPFTDLVNQTTYNKTWTGTLHYPLGRGSLDFSLNQSQRLFINSANGGSDKRTGLDASWSQPLSGRTSTTLRAYWSTAEAATQNSDFWALDWSLAHQISPRVTSSVDARHSEQNTNVATGNIKESTVSARLGMTF